MSLLLENSEAQPLLRGKLQPASPEAPGLQVRPRLLARLTEAIEQPLVLLSAPAGYGKSVLLAQHFQQLRQTDNLAVWLTCDEADSAPLRLARHMLAALSDLLPALKRPASLSGGADKALAERLLELALDELQRHARPLYLFVDELQALGNSDGARLAMAFLDSLPDNVRLRLASRDCPTLLSQHPLCRSGLQLHAADLAFDTDEFDVFLAQHDLLLTPAKTRRLQEETGGWPAAMRLFAQQCERGRHPDEALDALLDGCREVSDYLDEEVLQGRSPAFCEFLERTCVLESFCAELCDSLSGNGDGELRLRRLASRQLFLQPQPGRAGWYRYHPLLARHLQRRLARRGDPRGLALAAARWYDQHEDGELAVRQALLGEDYALVEQLLERHGHRLVRDNRVYGVLALLDRIPTAEIAERPVLRLFHAWRLAMDDRHAEAEALIEALIQDLAAGGMPTGRIELFGVAMVLKALVLLYQDKLERCLSVCSQWLQLVPEGQALFRASLACVQAAAYGLLGENRQALLSVEVSRAALELSHSAYLEAICGLIEALVRKEFGEIEHASERLERVRARAVEAFGGDARVSGPLLLAQIDLAYERDRHAVLLPQLLSASLRPDVATPLELLGRGELLQVRAAFFAGVEGDEPLRRLDAWLRQLRVSGAERLYALGMGCKIQLLLWRGRSGEAERTLQQLNAQLGGLDPARYADAFAALTLAEARQALHERRPERAQALLEEALDGMHDEQQRDRRLRLQCLFCVALWRRGQPGKAFDLWQQVLAEAWPLGYRRLFLDDALWLLPFARSWQLERGKAAAGWQHLLERLQAQCNLLGLDIEQLDQDQAISYREQEILRFVAAGLANRDIAVDLHLSEATVKWHLHRLFAKLGVRSRTQAVVEGKRRGLLGG